MSRESLINRIKTRLRFRMLDATIMGEGYEALITRNGIVIGRVYIGTIEEVENG